MKNIFFSEKRPRSRWLLEIPEVSLVQKSQVFSNGLFALIFAFYYSLFIDELDVTTYKRLQTWQGNPIPSEEFLWQIAKPF